MAFGLIGCQQGAPAGVPAPDTGSGIDSDSVQADLFLPDAGVLPDAMTDGTPDATPDAAGPLPDLTLLSARMANSIIITSEFFPGNDCALNECLTAFGTRRLIRFETAAFNTGTAALIMGPPMPSLPEWDYDSCHMHYHYIDFANYQLVDGQGNVVAVGHKQSFCVRDDLEVVAGAPGGYDCNNQGLSPGWADVYANALDCQFVDITGVAPGTYLLKIELNPARRFAELDYDNNVATFSVVID